MEKFIYYKLYKIKKRTEQDRAFFKFEFIILLSSLH